MQARTVDSRYVGLPEKCRTEPLAGGGSAASIYGKPVFRASVRVNDDALHGTTEAWAESDAEIFTRCVALSLAQYTQHGTQERRWRAAP